MRFWLPDELLDRSTVPVPVPRRRGPVRLCSRDGGVLHTLRPDERVGWGTRVIVWQGRAFLHWEREDWREVLMVQVPGEGSDDDDR